MKIAQLKIKQDGTGKLYVEGNYEFKVSTETILTEELVPTKTIRFSWSLDALNGIKEDEIFEILAERLREDFLNFCKQYNKQNHGV